MAFDTVGPLQFLLTLAQGVADGAQLGIPATLSTRLSCFLTVGDMVVAQHTVSGVQSGTIRRTQQYVVTFGYRVQNHEADAELAVAQAVADFTVAVYADRSLGGTVKSLRVDSTLVSSPMYSDIAAQENRLYPLAVEVQQDHVI